MLPPRRAQGCRRRSRRVGRADTRGRRSRYFSTCRLVISTRRRTSSASRRRTFSVPASGNSARRFSVRAPQRIGVRASARTARTGSVSARDASTARIRSSLASGWNGTMSRSPRLITVLLTTTGSWSRSSGQDSSRSTTAVSHSDPHDRRLRAPRPSPHAPQGRTPQWSRRRTDRRVSPGAGPADQVTGHRQRPRAVRLDGEDSRQHTRPAPAWPRLGWSAPRRRRCPGPPRHREATSRRRRSPRASGHPGQGAQEPTKTVEPRHVRERWNRRGTLWAEQPPMTSKREGMGGWCRRRKERRHRTEGNLGLGPGVRRRWWCRRRRWNRSCRRSG
ncbi:hypothetical protein SMICM17S_10995 [Streptomyces microflavus]